MNYFVFRSLIRIFATMNMEKKNEICLRVQALRAYMREKNLQAFIFPSTDPHCGEYIPDHWMTRQWISGFDGPMDGQPLLSGCCRPAEWNSFPSDEGQTGGNTYHQPMAQ